MKDNLNIFKLRFLIEETNSTSINTTNNTTTLMNPDHVWGSAVATSFGFLLLSLILTILIVLCNRSNVKKTTIKFINMCLISLAVGSLIGDSVIHIIPSVFGSGHSELSHTEEEGEVEEGEPDVRVTSAMMLIGFLSFFILEKAFMLFGCAHHHGEHHGEHEHEHGRNHEDHSHQENGEKKKALYENLKSKNRVENDALEMALPDQQINSEANQVRVIEVEVKEIKNEEEEIKKNSNESPKSEPKSVTKEEKESIKEGIFNFKNKKASAPLIIISDAIHNIMDGIALGMTFASRNITLIITTNIAIALHEIPKELGNAGILINAGLINKSVLFWNVINNVTAIIGTLIGLGLGNISRSSEVYCMSFVAGTFFYIAMAEMVPEIMKRKTLVQSLVQIFFIMLGFGIMFIILLIEGDEH